MEKIRIEIPWPPSKTSSNGSQGDWRGKAGAAKAYKAECFYEIKSQNVPKVPGVKSTKITYHPPRNGRFDWDNISNRAKQGFDAISEAIGVDDGSWWPVTLSRGDKVPMGRIVVEFEV